MRRLVLPFLLLASTLAAGQDEPLLGKKPYQVHPLEFEIGVPQGWRTFQDHTGLVARDRDKIGFQVTREPMLQDPKDFDEVWGKQLTDGGVKTKIKKARVGRYSAYLAEWDRGSRSIAIWRVHVPANEMLYNVAFSAERGTEIEPVAKVVLKSFKCTAKEEKLKFQPTAERLGPRVSMTVPVGYEKLEGRTRLALMPNALWTKQLKGYAQPHFAGLIGVGSSDIRIIGKAENAAQRQWAAMAQRVAKVLKKPRAKSARVGGLKGGSITAEVALADGVPKTYFCFAGKANARVVLFIEFLVDDRELRLEKDLFKKVLSKLEIQG